VVTFSCGHIVPPSSVLTCAISNGPTVVGVLDGGEMEFTAVKRMGDQLVCFELCVIAHSLLPVPFHLKPKLFLPPKKVGEFRRVSVSIVWRDSSGRCLFLWKLCIHEFRYGQVGRDGRIEEDYAA
jgi:hypothetical protein